jgi:5'-nucleotidase
VRWDPGCLRLYPDVRETRIKLAGDFPLGLIANQSKPVDDRLERYGIRGCFRRIICSCQVALKKPDLAIFKLAEEEAGASAGELWMIGDRPDNDIGPAKKLRRRTIRILQGLHMDYIVTDEAERADCCFDSIGGTLSLFYRN